jgi:membrane protein DedA with SNARE-associated domain
LLKHFLDWLATYGLPGVFFIGLFDSMGVPLPAVLDTLLIGIAIESPERAYTAAALALLGSMAGNIILFRTAHLGGRRFVTAETPEGKRQKFRRWFHRYGLLTIFIPGVTPFAPLPLKVFVISAGAMHTSFSRFVAVIFAARVLRYAGVAYLGIRLRQDAAGFLNDNRWNITVILLLTALVLAAIVKWYGRRREAV